MMACCVFICMESWKQKFLHMNWCLVAALLNMKENMQNLNIFKEIKVSILTSIEVPDDLKAVAEQIITIPNIASKRWIYVQYDSMVGTGNTSTNAPSDAAIVLAKPTNKALALTTDCNSRYVFADPYKGAMIAVAEAARNIVCSGGEPLGVTNCLNFGNPYDPEVYYQFVHAIKGMGEACRKFDTPVTGGNVSFYNQNPDGAVYPTPTIGMVGLLENIDDKMTMDFKDEGDIIFLIGKSNDDINSSEYLHKFMGWNSVRHRISISKKNLFCSKRLRTDQKKLIRIGT